MPSEPGTRVPFRTVVVFDGDGAVVDVEMDCLVCTEKGYKDAEAIVEHARTHPMPSSRMDAARFLIVQARSWTTLTEADIDRGARAVDTDPYYRREIVRDAMRHTDDHVPELRDRVRRSASLLNADTLETDDRARSDWWRVSRRGSVVHLWTGNSSVTFCGQVIHQDAERAKDGEPLCQRCAEKRRKRIGIAKTERGRSDD